MKMDQLVGERFKERPSDCIIDSHALMLRGGYMKYVANGIYSMSMPLMRITHKIENIIREQMDSIDGQEVLFPVVLPASLWEESGRFESVGSELVRLKDRNASPLVLGMTHEEAAVQFVRVYGNSYLKYPFMIYQIQTKFRDEARPRGGLIRVREFTMKDAYSFHTSQEDLSAYYDRCFHAYEQIFMRAGLKDVISVSSDSGMMGGSVSHEFMLLTPVGEDTIAICTSCGYRANMEAAQCIIKKDLAQDQTPLTLVPTPDVNTIEEVCHFLHIPQKKSVKAVVYQKNETDAYVVVFIRGDLEVNETKLTHLIGAEVHPAVITSQSGLCAGTIGPYELSGAEMVLFDASLEGGSGFVCGANKPGYHYTGLDLKRDVDKAVWHDLGKIKSGGICPDCGENTITLSRGIEVGNIFQLGTKYTKAMNMQYQGKDGLLHHPIMGCYGIGVGRLAASVCEACHDEYGPIWPMAIAPWQVHLCCLRADHADVKACADSVYQELMDNHVEVLYDNRLVSAGIMFTDADLMGIPLRVIISPRNLREGLCEIKSRDKSIERQVPLSELMHELKALINQMM